MTNLDLLRFFLGLSSGFRISLDLESSVVVLLLLSAIVEEAGGALLTSSQSWYTLNIWSRPWKVEIQISFCWRNSRDNYFSGYIWTTCVRFCNLCVFQHDYQGKPTETATACFIGFSMRGSNWRKIAVIIEGWECVWGHISNLVSKSVHFHNWHL